MQPTAKAGWMTVFISHCVAPHSATRAPQSSRTASGTSSGTCCTQRRACTASRIRILTSMQLAPADCCHHPPHNPQRHEDPSKVHPQLLASLHPPPNPQRHHDPPKVHPQLSASPHPPPPPQRHEDPSKVHSQGRGGCDHLGDHLDSKMCRGCCFSTRTSVSNNVCMDHLHCNQQQTI